MTSDRPRRHRRSIRLPGYDYTQAGAYFVTICTHEGECLFDDPVLRRVVEALWQELPRHFPRLSLDAWVVMPNHFHGIAILADARDVGAMHSYPGVAPTSDLPPGETRDVATGLPGNASPLRPAAMGMDPGGIHSYPGLPPTPDLPPGETPDVTTGLPGNASPLRMPSGAPSGSLGAILGNFKSTTARRINRIRKTPGMPVWQRNYYEHIIRTERALSAIREYITDNPARWRLDRYNTGADGPDPFAADLWRLLKEETP
jgi:putative transposase